MAKGLPSKKVYTTIEKRLERQLLPVFGGMPLKREFTRVEGI